MPRADQTMPSIYCMPLVLSNGVDFCHVDSATGTIGFKDQIKGCFPFWYRKGRPHGPDPLGLLRLPWHFVSPAGPVEVGTSEQDFDPRTAVVQTEMTLSGARLRLTAFLLAESCLVEHFDVLSVDHPDSALQLVAECPRACRSNKPVAAISTCGPEAIRFSLAGADGVIDYRYATEHDAFRGQFLSRVVPGEATVQVALSIVACGAAAGEERIEQAHDSHASSDRIVATVTGLVGGSAFSRITTVRDDKDGSDWRDQLASVHDRVCAQSQAERRGSHEDHWQAFSARSSLLARDAAAIRAFDVSAYVCRAALHANGSSVSALSLPNGHHMGTYWDTWYGHAGLLRFNRVAEARRIVDFWHRAWPVARRTARDVYDCPGARYAWVLRVDGEPAYCSPQVHNNLIPVVTLWDHYCCTLDRDLLEKSLPLMVECMVFLVAFALRQEADGTPYLREVISVDESLAPKRNELMTAIALARGIRTLHEAAEVLGQELPSVLTAAAPAVEAILDGLWTGSELRPYSGGSCANWAVPLSFIHFPIRERFSAVIDAALDGCAESHGLGIGRDSRMRCATFPWVGGIVAWAMARNGDPRATDYLTGMWQHRNAYGGLPEYMWLHGEPSRDWFVAAHGVYLAALAEVLVTRRGNDIHVAEPGVLDGLGGVQRVDGLRLPGALLVAITRDDDEAMRVRIHNDGCCPQSGQILVGDGPIGSFALPPDGRWSSSQ